MDTFEKKYLDDNSFLRKKETGGDLTLPLLNYGVHDEHAQHKHVSRTDFLKLEKEKTPIPLD